MAILMNSHLKKAIVEFLKQRDHSPEATTFQRLPGDGSRRIFWRIITERPDISFITMANPPADNAMQRENYPHYKAKTA